jgi:transposase
MAKQKRRVRRLWPLEEKRRIVAQALVPGISVSQVARRYDLNANQVFNWLRDPRFQPDDDAVVQSHFLPVEIVEEPVRRHKPEPSTVASIEIALANGRCLRLIGDVDPDAVARLVRSLEA